MCAISQYVPYRGLLDSSLFKGPLATPWVSHSWWAWRSLPRRAWESRLRSRLLSDVFTDYETG